MGIRNRINRQTEYNLKLSLKEDDYKHLEKFNQCIEGNYPIHKYKTTGFIDRSKSTLECRLFITNHYFGENLYDNYGMMPNRTNCSKLLKSIPVEFEKDFIRGILDADGSFTYYTTIDNGYKVNKYTVSVGSNEDIVKWIEQVFIKNKLVPNFQRKIQKRHKEDGKDGDYRTIIFSGKNCFDNILGWIYSKNGIYLDRKYTKYLYIIGGDAKCQ